MTITTTHPSPTATTGALLPAVVFLGATALSALGVFGDGTDGAEHSTSEFFVIAGLLLIVAYWSGLTPVLAVGGMVLGAAARRSGRRTGTGGVAVAIGALALMGYVAAYVTDWMATNNIAGM